jgi:hypothetical protein
LKKINRMKQDFMEDNTAYLRIKKDGKEINAAFKIDPSYLNTKAYWLRICVERLYRLLAKHYYEGDINA